jgi:hypothetical protein
VPACILCGVVAPRRRAAPFPSGIFYPFPGNADGMGAGQSQSAPQAQAADAQNSPPAAGYEELARRYEEALRIVSNDQMVLGDPLTSIGAAEGQMLEQLKRYVKRGGGPPESDTVLYQAVSAFVRDTAGFRAGLEEALAQSQGLSQPMKELVARLIERQTDLVVGKLFYQYKYLHLSSVTLATVETSVRFIGDLVRGLEGEAMGLEAEADGKLQALVRSAAEGSTPDSGAPGIIRNAEAVRADLTKSLRDLAGRVRSLGADAMKAVGRTPGELIGKQMDAEAESLKARSKGQVDNRTGSDDGAAADDDGSDEEADEEQAEADADRSEKPKDGPRQDGKGRDQKEGRQPAGDTIVTSIEQNARRQPEFRLREEEEKPNVQGPGFVRFEGRQDNTTGQSGQPSPSPPSQGQGQQQPSSSPAPPAQNPQGQAQGQAQGQGQTQPPAPAPAPAPQPAPSSGQNQVQGQSGGDALLGVAHNLFMRDVTARMEGDFAPGSLYL